MKLVAEVKTQTIENGFVILVAPYISPAAIQVCREAGIGCMDLSGNVFLSFGNVFKDKIGELLNFSYIGRDVGIAGAVTKRHIMEERGEAFGRAFEHFILMELAAHASYRELHYGIRYWRTKTGQEIDFILGDGEIALEVARRVHGGIFPESRDRRFQRNAGAPGGQNPRRALALIPVRTLGRRYHPLERRGRI
jgi:hypothetical protein